MDFRKILPRANARIPRQDLATAPKYYVEDRIIIVKNIIVFHFLANESPEDGGEPIQSCGCKRNSPTLTQIIKITRTQIHA